MTDSRIFVICFSVFMVLALAMPVIQSAIGDPVSRLDANVIGENINEDVVNGDTSPLTYILEVGKAISWTIPNIPIWLNTILWVLRIYCTIYLITLLPFFGG